MKLFDEIELASELGERQEPWASTMAWGIMWPIDADVMVSPVRCVSIADVMRPVRYDANLLDMRECAAPGGHRCRTRKVNWKTRLRYSSRW